MIVSSARKLAPLLGVSHTRINDLVRSGRITRTAAGFDLDQVRDELTRNLDPAQPKRVIVAPPRVQPRVQMPPRRIEESGPQEPNPNEEFAKARAAHEKIRAKDRELDLRKKLGQLLPAEEVEDGWSKIIAAIRSRMLLLPDKLAPKVAVVSDVIECRAVIWDEVVSALAALSATTFEAEDAV